jgi:tetratricopeptide (TPR) repeat protein
VSVNWKRRTLVAGLVLAVATVFGLAAAGSSEAESAPRPAPFAQARAAAYAHLMRALIAARQGEFTLAAAQLHQALERQPDEPDLLVEAADLFSAIGRGGEAERLARRALDLAPEHGGALRFVADAALTRALGSEKDDAATAEALRLYEKLDSIAEEVDADLLGKLIQLRHHVGDLEGAVHAGRRLVENRPGDPRAVRTLAQLLLQRDDEAGALEVLLRYVAEHPLTEDLPRFAEQLAHSLEAWELVVQVLHPHHPFPPEVDVVQRLLGESLLRVGRTREAIDVLERARDSRPDDLRVRNHLALAYRGVGRLADAAELLARLIHESPEFPSLPQLLAETLAGQGDVTGSLEAYAIALRGWESEEGARPIRDAIRQQMALLHLSQGKIEAATAALAGLEKADGAGAARVRGRIALAAQDWEGARQAARELRELGETGVSALIEGESLAREGRWSRAVDRFEESILDLGPQQRHVVAEIYRTAGRPEDGLDLLQTWVQQEPANAEASFLLGEYLYQIGRLDEAEAALRQAFTLDPRHAPALNFLGYSLAERDVRLDEALSMIARALEIDAWNGAYLDSLGWAYYRLGRYAEARPALERAVRELPHDPTVLEHLGDLYRQLGERAAARTAWERALAAGAAEPEALRAKIDREGAPVAEPGGNTGEVEQEQRAKASSLPPGP